MAKKRIAINGFGRIGRLTFRNLIKNSDVEVVAINDLTDNTTLAHLLKYDTMHGRFDGTVSADETHITVNGQKIAALAVRNPAELPWAEMKVDVVLECTGIFLDNGRVVECHCWLIVFGRLAVNEIHNGTQYAQGQYG